MNDAQKDDDSRYKLGELNTAEELLNCASSWTAIYTESSEYSNRYAPLFYQDYYRQNYILLVKQITSLLDTIL